LAGYIAAPEHDARLTARTLWARKYYARLRQAWLLALGLGGWLRAAIPEIDAALVDLG
jgi:hypothetical protein